MSSPGYDFSGDHSILGLFEASFKVIGEALSTGSAAQSDDSADKSRMLWRPWPDPPGKVHPQRMAIDSEADDLLYGGAAGGGKALDVETLIPTPLGLRRMGDLRVGDEVYDETGQPTRIIAATEEMHGRPCFVVCFDDGTDIVADGSHLWYTETAREAQSMARRDPEWKAKRRESRASRSVGARPDLVLRNEEQAAKRRESAEEVSPGGRVRRTIDIAATVALPTGRTNHRIPVAAALQGTPQALLIDPYVLGAWLGDGTTKAGSITGIDEEVFAHVEAAGYKVRPQPSTRFTRGVLGLKADLRSAEVLDDKHIPEEYHQATFAERLALLQGLMDTDGSAATDGQCEFTGTNEPLCRDVLRLVWSLGIKAFWAEGRAMLKGRDCGPKYRVTFTTSLPVFRIARKAARLPQKVRPTTRHRYILSVRPVETRPVRCIQVDSPRALYLAGPACIPTHNSDLLIGLPLLNHEKAIIFRREFTQVEDLQDRAEQIIGTVGKFNAQKRRYLLPGGRMLRFGAMQRPNDWKKYKGRPNDYIGWDELSEFERVQFRTMFIWNRSTTPGQRTRVVATTNPPTEEEQLWVIEEWAPWLDPDFPDPAEPGELRFYVYEGPDRIVWFKKDELDENGSVMHKGQMLRPRSRTFVPARVHDNPALAGGDYERTLDALPESLRDAYRDGKFSLRIEEDPWRIIPTAWVRAAQMRWMALNQQPGRLGQAYIPEEPLTAIGGDPSRGGADDTVLAPRFGSYFGALSIFPAAEIPDGPAFAEKVREVWEEGAFVVIDVIGIGASAYDSTKAFVGDENTVAFNGAAKSRRRDKTGRFKFANKRAEAYWRLREALDPNNEVQVALPDDAKLRADLTAVRYRVTRQGIQAEEKASVHKRLGRSPDRADAVVMANFVLPAFALQGVVVARTF